MSEIEIETEKVYAKCQECGVDLADRDAVSAHGKETMAPTPTSEVFSTGVVARGHRVSIINPTETEKRASRVRRAVSDALETAYEEIFEGVERQEFTAAEVTANLWMFDLHDGWANYVGENEDEEMGQ